MKNILISTIIALIIGCLIGFILGKSSVKIDPQNTFKTGWNSLKKRVIASGMYSNNDQISSFSGKISKLKNGSLVLNLTVIDPFWDTNLDSRLVFFDSTTKIIKSVKKDDVAYDNEMTEALKNKNNLSPDSPDGLPGRYYNQDADISILKDGQTVIVKVDTEENLKLKKEFKVNKIIIKD